MRDRLRFAIATIGGLSVIAAGAGWQAWERAHPHQQTPATTISKPADAVQSAPTHS